MSSAKMIVPGFGIGSVYGTPTTLALAQTSTLSVTAALVGQYHVAGLVTGTSLTLVSTSNGVTGTYTILNGAPGRANLDGSSAFLVNTTTSINVTFIGAF